MTVHWSIKHAKTHKQKKLFVRLQTRPLTRGKLNEYQHTGK